MANMPVFQGIILQRCIAKLLKTCKMTFFNRWGVENLQHAKLSWRRPMMSMHVWWAPASYKWSYNPTYNWARAHLTGETIKTHQDIKYKGPRIFEVSATMKQRPKASRFVAVIQKNCSPENDRLEPENPWPENPCLEKGKTTSSTSLFFWLQNDRFPRGFNLAPLSLLLCFRGLFFFVFFFPGFFSVGESWSSGRSKPQSCWSTAVWKSPANEGGKSRNDDQEEESQWIQQMRERSWDS